MLESDFSSANLVATIATYFDFNTGSAEIESAAAADKIHDADFRVENLIGPGFRNQYGTQIYCRPNEPRTANLTYFAFRSAVRASTLDSRCQNNEIFFDFFKSYHKNLLMWQRL